MASAAQVRPVLIAQYGAATGRENALVMAGQVIKHGRLNVTKPVFAFALEIFADRTAQLLLDHLVGIGERHAKPSGKLATYGGFTGARKPDEGDFQGILMR
jgi:hypothetical protein